VRRDGAGGQPRDPSNDTGADDRLDLSGQQKID
jgi:hypothetical protein